MKLNSIQIAQIIVETSEEIKKEVLHIEEIAKDISLYQDENYNRLKGLNFDLDDTNAMNTIKEYEKVLENAKKQAKNERYAFSYIYFFICIIFFVAGCGVFYYGSKKFLEAQKMEEKHRDAMNLNRKFWKWADKNPKDSKKMIDRLNEY